MFKQLLFLLIFSSIANAANIEQIEIHRDRGYDYLDIYTTGWVEAKGLMLEDKLYIDFPAGNVSREVEILKGKSSRIKNIEIAGNRIVIWLKKESDYDIVNVFGRNKTVVEIGDRIDNLIFQFARESKSLEKRAAPLKPVKLAAAETGVLRDKTIILDPGHGGDDPGAFSVSGVPEKALTLKTAQAAAKLLRQAGATVYLTRNEDRRSNLPDVVEFANRSGADALISIHFNSGSGAKISGTETYYHNPISKKFAEKMHEAVVRGIRRRDRGLHRVRFYVVKNTAIPSALLEPVYLSNPEENGLANSAAFRQELAADIYQGVKNYFRNNPR